MKEDPEAKARRQVEEARAEADKTSAIQNLLDRRTRKILRIFGKSQGGAGGNPGSGSGVPGAPITIADVGGGFFGSGATPGITAGGRPGGETRIFGSNWY